MLESLLHLRVDNDELVGVDHMLAALTAGTLAFPDGATQVFTSDGRTTYTEGGRSSAGEWWVVGEGRFGSFWPPDYRATYTLRWVVAHGSIAGVSFTATEGGTRFDGRYL